MGSSGRRDGSPRWLQLPARAHRWRQLIAPSSARFNVVVWGDSNTDEDSVYTTWVERLRSELQREHGVGGIGYQGLWRNEYAFAGSWARQNDKSTFDRGPYGWSYSADAQADILTWTKPGGAGTIDRFEVFYVDADFIEVDYQYSVDGGAWTALALDYSGAGPALRSKTIAATITTSLRLRGPAVFVGHCAGVAFYSGTTGCVVHNLGSGGESIATACDDGDGDRLAIIDVIQPKLTLVNLLTNDTLTSVQTPLASYEAWLGTLVDRSLAHGDVLLIAPQMQDPSGAFAYPAGQGHVTQRAYEAKLAAVADTKRVPVVSLAEAWGSYTALQTLGYSADSYHLNQAGQDAAAALISQALRHA